MVDTESVVNIGKEWIRINVRGRFWREGYSLVMEGTRVQGIQYVQCSQETLPGFHNVSRSQSEQVSLRVSLLGPIPNY